ncbi:urease accessory UreF family protein [Paenibacillus sp. VCA1]|uniref:urease accessory UreF family protein n=1 Tax=Paenibacillus sp. VCA1 TaxID=3039148 RepID=UPI00287227B5|nr:urease accessory UreF family protein [Paenibacillus sp. VCA1]MDR9856104.1 urease accessory UreF family protein [Paenibacillus sp. VCA1]
MNDKSTKLLDYVQMLDHDLSVGSFSCLPDLKNRISDGRIQTQAELEGFFLHPMTDRLVRQDGAAIQAIYEAAELLDIPSIARIDRLLLGQTLKAQELEAASKRGKKLVKLAQALYPFLNLAVLEEMVHNNITPACLATVHAYINYQLGTSCDQAVYGYMQSAVYTCVYGTARPLNIPRPEAKMLAGKWTAEMEKAWLLEKDALTKERFESKASSPHIA